MVEVNVASPYTQLRRKVRQAGRQFRKDNDNSQSLFQPEQGFVYAYDLCEVERALDEYEKTLPTEFNIDNESLEHQIVRDGKLMAATHPSMAVRDFARMVLAHIALEKKAARENPLRLLVADYLKPVD